MAPELLLWVELMVEEQEVFDALGQEHSPRGLLRDSRIDQTVSMEGSF